MAVAGDIYIWGIKKKRRYNVSFPLDRKYRCEKEQVRVNRNTEFSFITVF